MRSMTMVLPRRTAAPVTVAFSTSTARRLGTKGGALKISAHPRSRTERRAAHARRRPSSQAAAGGTPPRSDRRQ